MAWIGMLALALLHGAFTLASADLAADRCGSAKEKGAGRFGQTLLKCHAKATRRVEPLDPGCAAKASSKLAGVFTKADSRGGCVTSDDAGSIETSVTVWVDAVVAAVTPDPDNDARICAAAKMKSSGKHYAGRLSCYSSGARRSEGPDSRCLERAYEKLVKGFSRAESKGGCTTVDDLGAIDSADTIAAREAVAALSPVCSDGVTGPTQECEPEDDAACPGLCGPVCECVVPPDCGDGAAVLPEECDDGGQVDGDGCSALCQLEDDSAVCTGVASSPGTAIDAVLVSAAFNQPIFATAPPLDPSRLFVVEREGVIRIVDLSDDTLVATNFLSITGLVGTSGEGGLLSMAFDPNYDSNRRFFVNYTNNSGHTTIARYEASMGDPNVADAGSARVLLVINQPESNHNGGQIAFGPDGYLYVGMGDGGGGGDPYETARNDSSLLGKMLRLDVDVSSSPYYAVPPTNPGYVDGSDPLELIWAKGLRNPWRFSFDMATGDMLIADVGQNSREEIDFQAAASTGGENYGWDIFEGSLCYEPDPAPMCPAPPAGYTMPIHEYSHSGPCTSLTGGFVYRGCAQPDLAGTYFYSDVCRNFVNTIDIVGGAAVNPQNRTADVTSAGASLNSVASFGQDARGELYILDLGGSVYRMQPQ